MGVDLLTTSSASFTDAMGEFLQKYDGHPAIKSCFKSGEIQEILSVLIQFLIDRSSSASQHSSDLIQALRCIKLLTRTRAELDILLEERNIICMMDLASRELSSDVNLRNSIANEAIRCLINLCIIHQKHALVVLHRQRVHLQLLDLLNDLSAAPANDDLIFAISRLLFYVCLDDHIQRNLGDSNAIRLLADKVIQYVDTSDPGSISFTSGSSTTCAAVSELLRVLFALGSNQESKSDSQQLWQSLTAPLLRLLLGPNIKLLSLSHEELQILPKSPYYMLMLDIVHLFYCFDESSLQALLEKEAIYRILEILEVQARYNCASVESALVPILTILKDLCELNPNVAQDAKEFVFGDEFANNKSVKYEFEAGDTILSVSPADGTKPNSPPPTLQKILRQLITTFNPNVKDAVSRFLFTICGCEANEYIRVVGFGNAIGLLAQLDLPGFKVPLN